MQATSSPRSGKAASAGIAIAGFLGVLCGALLTVWLRPPAATKAASALPNPARDDRLESPPGIEAELRAIRMLLEDWRSDSSGAAPARVPAEDVAGQDAGEAPDLEALLAEAITALQRAPARAAPSRELLFPPSPRPNAFPDRGSPEFDELMHELLLHSQQQILDCYGKPDRVGSSEDSRTSWTYDLDGGKWVTLEFHDGLLYRCMGSR